MTISWQFAHFAQLTPQQLHDAYRLRLEAFVVEQKCVFQDVDGLDPQCSHLLGYAPSLRPSPKGEGEQLVAYCRFVPPGTKYAEPSIGRVVTAGSVRGTGLGRVLVGEALARADQLWPGRAIRIGAQKHLERFYNEFGFTTASEPYDEDGILHIEMLRPASVHPDRTGQKVGQE